jgi:hypothetical protein
MERGSVIVVNILSLEAPRFSAASSTDESIDSRIPESVRYATGKNDIT